jgi:hypothetical protein
VKSGAVPNREETPQQKPYRAWGKYRITEIFS